MDPQNVLMEITTEQVLKNKHYDGIAPIYSESDLQPNGQGRSREGSAERQRLES